MPNNSFQCEYCEKSFTNADGLFQHKIAKHEGSHTQTVPYWKESSATRSLSQVDQLPIVADASEHICTVCGDTFPTVEALEYHEKKGFLPIDEEYHYTCCHCEKQFSNLRAFQQHDNFCKLSIRLH